jgi:hypothetical protein
LNGQKSCKNCLKSFSISINGDYICKHKGVVSGDYFCKKHKYFDLSQINVKLLKCIDCSYFVEPENQITQNIGICSIFTERQFNGTQKKACSRIKPKKLHLANISR